ncbi:hypothetical protein E4T56_gene20402 [Termitomyces sp. T112]|nr:hypothetical protein E4T56_gene20402 [Termitomyces sp. T112]
MHITLDPPPLEDPLPLNGPQGLPQAMQANPLAEVHLTADPLEDEAQPWTTSPPPGLEDTLDCGPDSSIFSAPATLLHATVLIPDNFPAHLPSYSSTTLLLCTTLPFFDNSVPTLVNSGTIDNFIDESLVALTSHLLQCLPAPIPLKLFNSGPTPTRDITHHLEMTMTFANKQQQELWLLVMKLHPSAPCCLRLLMAPLHQPLH